jgi:ABC-2 type transport system permease protein
MTPEGFGEPQGGAPMHQAQGLPARGPIRVSRELAPWLRVWAVARRHAYVLVRSPHRLFDVTVWPIVDTVLFGSLGVFFVRQGGPSSAAQAGVAYLLSGIVLWHVVYQAQIAVSTGFMEETWSRNLLSLMVTPLKELELVAGIALFGLAKLVMGVGVVALAAYGLYAFDVTTLGLGLVPVMAILLMGGWAIALLVVGLMLRFGNGAEALAWGIMFVVMPLGGVFYPVEALPWFVRPVSELLPTTHAFAAGRDLIDGGPMPWGELAQAAIGTLVAVAAALAFVAWMLRLFRRRGYVTRYS